MDPPEFRGVPSEWARPARRSALDDIAAERRRQVEIEGWTHKHDDAHVLGEMACAAACYAISSHTGTVRGDDTHHPLWPWDWSWWKPKDRRANLVRAAALLVAEIERLDRAEARKVA